MDARVHAEKLAALVLLGLGVAFYSVFAFGEMVGGDLSGIQHVPPALALAGLFWLAWKRPYTAGIVLLALALPLGAAYLAFLVVRELPLYLWLLIALPPFLTGLLLFQAGRGERGSRRV